MKYFIVLGLLFVQSSLGMHGLKFLVKRSPHNSPKNQRRILETRNSEEKFKIVNNQLATIVCPLTVAPGIIENANIAKVVRVEESSDLNELIDFLESKLAKENNLKNQETINYLEAMRENMKGSIATVSPQEIAKYFMPYLFYVPTKKKKVSVIPSFEFDISDTICIIIDNKGKNLTGSLAKCINGLYGLHMLYEKTGLILSVDGKWNKNDQLLFSTLNSETIEKLLKMSHHPYREKII